VVDEYIKSQLETKSEGARHAAEWLEVRLAELGDTVRSLEQNVERQRQDSGSNLKDIVSQRLGQLNIQLADAQAQSVAAAARYEQVRKVLESRGNLDSLPAIIASGTIQAFRAKRAELIGTLSELRTIYGPKHPRIIAIQAEINEVDGRVSREINNTLAGLRNEMESAQIHEARLRSDLEALSKEMVHLNEADASIGQVAQRLNANQDLYQNLLKRYTEAVALRDNQQPDARIVSPAQMPLSPSHPNVPRVTALAFIGSASLAVLLLVVTERLRQKLGSVEDVERHVGLRVIGVIPDLSRFRRLASGPRDYIQREPLSEFGGAFQRLRALLTLSNNRVMPRTVLVTSCTGGEGKTTISVCLGIASMTSGQKVLLVDCDFARPQVHRMLDVKKQQGTDRHPQGHRDLAGSDHPGGRIQPVDPDRRPLAGRRHRPAELRADGSAPGRAQADLRHHHPRLGPGPGVERVDPRRPGRKDHLRDPARMDHAPRGVLRHQAAPALWRGHRGRGLQSRGRGGQLRVLKKGPVGPGSAPRGRPGGSAA
jgi:polysaccharide biosynthesis transport protein